MVGKKKLALILSGLLVMTGLMSCSSNNSSEKGENATKASETTNEDGKTYTIGINQLVQHDALDASREGFIEGLKEKGFEEGKNLKINYQNAQGDMAIAKTISDQFVTSKVDLIFAIATSSLQASYNSTKDIPIVFTAVTDPIDAGVAKSWESSGTNVTGTSDMVSMEKQLELLTKLVPDIKTIGVIYNSSEANSLAQVQELKKEAEKKNIKVKEISVTTVNEINQNLTAALGEIDALYAPTDNTVASAYDLVGNICLSKNIPILCGE